MQSIYPRTSIVDHLSVDSVSQSAHLHIGDSRQIRARNNVIAIQQVPADFVEDLYSFNDFEIFHRPEILEPFPSDVRTQTFHQSPVIKVHHIRIIGVAGSSVVHIGSTETIHSDTRIHHIRDFRTYVELEESKKNKQAKERSSCPQ